MVSRASFRSLSLRSAFVADCDATPPPPNLLPARFWKSAMMGVRSRGLATMNLKRLDVISSARWAEVQDVRCALFKVTRSWELI